MEPGKTPSKRLASAKSNQVSTRSVMREHANDLIHAVVVLVITAGATFYAAATNDHSGNIWIVYGSGIAYAAGRSGSIMANQIRGRRATDPTEQTENNNAADSQS